MSGAGFQRIFNAAAQSHRNVSIDSISTLLKHIMTQPLVSICVALVVCGSRPGSGAAGDGTGIYCDPYKEVATLLLNYSRVLPPPGYPVEVVVDAVIYNVRAVSSIDSTAVVYSGVSVTWQDTRLKRSCSPKGPPILLDQASVPKLWMPAVSLFSAMRNDRNKLEILRIDPNGTIFVWYTYSSTISCETNFHPFPFDKLRCTIGFGSMLSPAAVKLRWKNESDGVKFDTIHLKQAEYRISGDVLMQDCSAARAKTCLLYDVYLSRFAGYYILQTYVPSGLITMVAMLSFLLGVDVIATRISLGISALVAMTLQHGKAVSDLPKVGYIKGIDVWMLGCTISVMLIICQASVLAFYKRCLASNEKATIRLPARVAWIDRVTGVGFLLACGIFVLWYVLYWT